MLNTNISYNPNIQRIKEMLYTQILLHKIFYILQLYIDTPYLSNAQFL
jgi:hypothetical protein